MESRDTGSTRPLTRWYWSFPDRVFGTAAGVGCHGSLCKRGCGIDGRSSAVPGDRISRTGPDQRACRFGSSALCTVAEERHVAGTTQVVSSEPGCAAADRHQPLPAVLPESGGADCAGTADKNTLMRPLRSWKTSLECNGNGTWPRNDLRGCLVRERQSATEMG